MIIVRFAPQFLKDTAKLPVSVKELLKEQIRCLVKDPQDSRLHTKKLRGKLSGLLSFRVTRNYRVIYRRDGKEILLLLTVDDRKDIYR